MNNISDFRLDKPLERGTFLIEASAGTGKTFSIAGLFIKLLIEKDLNIDEILVVTFTRAATSELRERIRTQLKDILYKVKNFDRDYISKNEDDLLKFIILNNDIEKIEKKIDAAIKNFDEASIYTIDSFCQRVLQDNAFESRAFFDSVLETDENEILNEISDDYWRVNIFNAPDFILQYLFLNKFKQLSLNKILNEIKRPLISIKPGLKFEPGIDIDKFSKKIEKLYSIFDQIVETWDKDKNVIKNILLNTEGFHSGRFNKDQIVSTLKTFSLVIEKKIIYSTEKGKDPFEKLSGSVLEKNLKKGFIENKPGHILFRLCDDFVESRSEINNMFQIYILELKMGYIKYFNDEESKRKKQKNILFYKDLRNQVYDTLNNQENLLQQVVSKKYKAALIDEFQDTDPIQYEIFIKLFKTEKNYLYLIGDPKQAIYGFRGADIFSYLKASRSSDNIKLTLRKNWRSGKGFVNAINTLFNKENSFVFNEIKYSPVDSSDDNDEKKIFYKNKPLTAFEIALLEDNEKGYTVSEAEDLINNSIACKILDFLQSSGNDEAYIEKPGVKIYPEDIAVLVRSNQQARNIMAVLKNKNIPAVIQSMESVYKSDEMVELYRVLCAIEEPKNSSLIKAALATDLFDFNAGKILNLIEDEKLWGDLLISFHNLHRTWERDGISKMFKHLLLRYDVKQNLLSLNGGERKLTNILHLVELFHNEEIDKGYGIRSLMKHISSCYISDIKSDQNQMRLERDDRAVQIMTIHRSKGLQFPVVFCPFMWKSSLTRTTEGYIYHDENDNLVFDISDDMDPKDIEKSHLEIMAEDLRLLYVALTRAKYHSVMYWGKINRSAASSISYLLLDNKYSGNNFYKDINDKYKNITWGEIYNLCKELEKKSSGDIAVSLVGVKENSDLYVSDKVEESYNLPVVNRVHLDNWKITSYSHIVNSVDYQNDLPDYFYEQVTETTMLGQNIAGTIFDFPKGAVAGNALHSVFENINFNSFKNNDTVEIIKRVLDKFSFDSNEYGKVIYDMVENVLYEKLLTNSGDEIILSSVDEKFIKKEMEFYFSIKNLDIKKICKIFKKYRPEFITEKFSSLSLDIISGFLKGFIDMVFEYNNKYYIIDWKSNHLGDSIDQYNKQNIANSMNDHLYILQYHIYVVALNKYLKYRVKDYDYKKYFGGCFYIFLRGIHKDNNEQHGVYFDFPGELFINELSDAITGDS